MTDWCENPEHVKLRLRCTWDKLDHCEDEPHDEQGGHNQESPASSGGVNG